MGSSGSLLRAPYSSVEIAAPPVAIEDYYYHLTATTDPLPLDQWLSQEGQFFNLKSAYKHNTLMHLATIKGNVPLIQCLARHDPQLVNTASSFFGYTPLQVAVIYGPYPEVVKCLLELGANRNLGMFTTAKLTREDGFYGENMTALNIAQHFLRLHRELKSSMEIRRRYSGIITMLRQETI